MKVMISDQNPVISVSEIQAVSDRIASGCGINRRLHRCRRVASRRKHGIQPTGHRRSELPRLVDHLCNTVRITSAFHPVQDHRPDCNLSLVRLVSRFTENDGRKQRLFLRRKRHFLLLGCRTLLC